MDERTLQEKHHGSGLTRRRFTTGLCLGLVTALSGCGGSSESAAADTPDTSSNPPVAAPPTRNVTTGSAAVSAPPPAAAPSTSTPASPATTTTTSAPATWSVADNGALALTAGATFDLAATLPSGVARGGLFEVDAGGAALPAGITLLPTGLLTVSSSASGATSGVVFRYTPPA